LGCVEVVARVVRRALAAVRVLRDPAVAGLALVVRLFVVAGLWAPDVLVAIGSPYLRGIIERVFVNHSVEAVTANHMKSS
jgi:hypothetical protein